MDIPTIKTERLILRPFTEADVEPLHNILGEEDMLRYFPSSAPPPREKVEKLVSRQLEDWEKNGYGWWAVELRSHKGIIGWCGLGYLPETDETEVAYLIAKPFWGQGLTTEGARASVRYGFQELGMETIIGIVHPENIASQRVLEKVGMTFDERTEYWGMDCFHYSMGRTVFQAQE